MLKTKGTFVKGVPFFHNVLWEWEKIIIFQKESKEGNTIMAKTIKTFDFTKREDSKK